MAEYQLVTIWNFVILLNNVCANQKKTHNEKNTNDFSFKPKSKSACCWPGKFVQEGKRRISKG